MKKYNGKYMDSPQTSGDNLLYGTKKREEVTDENKEYKKKMLNETEKINF